VLGRVGIGATHQKDVVGGLGLGRPDLLALMTHSSPSRTALVFRLARSLPELGSEKPWHHAIFPCRMPGMNSFFCSSVPTGGSWDPPRCHEEVRAHRRTGAGELLVEYDLL